ncbi:MAG: hypothetical protein EP317_04270, partial [Bacillota bacterium]
MKLKDIFTLIWYNIKSKKRSAFYLLIGFFFMVLLIQSFLVYTSVLDGKYKDIVKNDEHNYLTLDKAIDQMDFDYLRSFNKTEFVISTNNMEVENFVYQVSTLSIDGVDYSYDDPNIIPKLSTFNIEFKEYYHFLIPFFLKNYDADALLGGRYLNQSGEVLLSANFLAYYGLTLDDVLFKTITLKDGLNAMIDEMYVAGVLKDEYFGNPNELPVNLFKIVTLNNQGMIQDVSSHYDVNHSYYNRIYFSTYEAIMITVNEMKNHFGSNLIDYSGQVSADMVVLIVRQSIFAQEMFKLIGSILIVAMLISIMISIIFRIKNQAVYISISHVYGMKKRYLLLSIYIEFLSIYLAATILSTFLSYGLFRLVNRIFEPTFMISL